MPANPQETYGNIDIYLFDQLLKGTYQDCKKVLDIGCGGGRNLHYFLSNHHEVFGVDQSADGVNAVRSLSSALAPNNPVENFSVANADDLPFIKLSTW
jgi:SAM-dependent methyltransferase